MIRQTSETHNAMMRDMMKEIQDGTFYKKPLPERLQYQETHLAARLAEVKSVHEAVDKLYAVLHDGQKKVAGDIILSMTGMVMGRGRGMMFRSP